MLQKLRSRHPIDLPMEYPRRRPTLAILGGIALLTLLIPLAIAFLGPLARAARAGDLDVILAVGAGIGTLLVVLVIGAIIGKPGHAR